MRVIYCYGRIVSSTIVVVVGVGVFAGIVNVCTLVRVLMIEANGCVPFGWDDFFFCFAIISWHLHQNMNICQLGLLQKEMIWN